MAEASNASDYACPVIEQFVCLFLNPVPQHVAVHFASGHAPVEMTECDNNWLCYWAGIPTPAANGVSRVPMYEEAIRVTPTRRHCKMIRTVSQCLKQQQDTPSEGDAFKDWLLRGLGLPEYWQGDFGAEDFETHIGFHAQFGSWRLPPEITRCLDGRIHQMSLCPLLRDMRDWLLTHSCVLHPSCAVPKPIRWNTAVQSFMVKHLVLPHGVALQFCLTPDERRNIAAVADYMAFGSDSLNPSLDPVRRWVMRSAGWDLPEIPVLGVGKALLDGLHAKGHLTNWSCLPYAVALHLGIGRRERAMSDWLQEQLRLHHPAILTSSSKKMDVAAGPNGKVWYWLMKSVGRAGQHLGFKNGTKHRAFYRQFGSWRLPDEVVERLDRHTGVWGLSPVLVDMYHWMIENEAYVY
jgi:hypothetical protein